MFVFGMAVVADESADIREVSDFVQRWAINITKYT